VTTEAPLMKAKQDWRERSTLTVEEAGFVLGIGRSSAYYAARTGDIPTIRIGGRVLVPVAALRRLLGELLPTDEERPAGRTMDHRRGAHKTDDGGPDGTVPARSA
jgi:excisionase family DNA binding protein